MKTIALNAQVREGLGKGKSRRLRTDGHVPAIFYGYETESMAVKVNTSELIKALVGERRESIFVRLAIETVDGAKVEKLSIIKDMQLDTVNRKPVHVDFYEIRMDGTLAVDVPIVLSGNAAGVEAGGELQQLKRSIKISGLPADLPESLEVDVSALEIGDSIKVKDVATTDAVQTLDHDDVAIVSVGSTRVSLIEEEETGEEEAAADAASTPEGEEEQSE